MQELIKKAEVLTEPKNALVRQYCELMKTEGISLSFNEGSIREIAITARIVNDSTENIGARRLHTIMEKLLETLSFDAPEMKNQKIEIDADEVRKKLADIAKDEDLSRFIL